MAVDVLDHPEQLTMSRAEKITGFREGVETWPYAMLAWLAESGCQVLHEDALDAVAPAPDPRRLPVRLRAGWLPLLSLDAAVLSGRDRDGFEGHMVLLTGLVGGWAVVQDPGPPARWDWAVPLPRIAAALRSPANSSGTITHVRSGTSRTSPPPSPTRTPGRPTTRTST